jgi:hypothetical protein
MWKQPLVLHQRRQLLPQLNQAVPRLVTHIEADKDAGTSHALLPQALQPRLDLILSMLLTVTCAQHARL